MLRKPPLDGAGALIDSGIPLAAAIVFVILGTGYGIWMARRMARYWPGARELSPPLTNRGFFMESDLP